MIEKPHILGDSAICSQKVHVMFVACSGTIEYNIYQEPEFCKGLSKKCPEHRINRGVPGIFEMHGNVVFSSLF